MSIHINKKSLFVKRPIKAHEVKQLSNDIKLQNQKERLEAEIQAGGKWVCIAYPTLLGKMII